ncbi:RagB/SusD family nutrient uptake outer membrane protein [Flectobacillus sp. BAB-3569]|uniref:RagB/SusD family nutrient uptake outer membrane protein n=1 Tax=Flectobacillus sp. BAB-3569 TaxID=1509483 RepID=UPI000BA30768|nr:RagB/SusD family nutrient uptake outer membrane protein [Flectobacillus sp. BAB-3569]NBA75624.1 RagB/SusD family nutrient uptake outer membrane protein [Emticicia sp. ODNR4P]PAC28771.1 RagB/SusD family nutrient uptake outer membrane protein [Flectobacillus sp. BAB-3569]
MKSRKFIAISSCLFSVLLSTASCNSDLLDVVPTDRVSDSSILTDSTLFESYVINRYMGVRLTDKEAEGTPPGFGRGFEYAMWSSVTDESIYNNDDNTWLIQRGQLAPENTGIAGTIWGRSYRSIREINYALANVQKVNMSAGMKTRLTAELRFLRAFRYQDLLRNYGDVVLMGDKVYELGEDFSNSAIYTRSSIKDVTAYILAELDAASKDLPAANNNSNWRLGRATKGAALALKARIALYAASPLYNAGTWQAAASAAKDVMNMGMYSLYTGGYDKLFLTAENNPEIIFERLYTRGARHVCLEISNGPNSFGGWGGNVPLQNFVDAYQMNNGKSIDDATSGYNPQDPYKNRDPRFYMTVLTNDAAYRGNTVQTFVPGGKDSKDGPSNWNTSKTGYYLKKYMNDALPIDNPWDIAGTQPWIYFRYAEILLNYAEAQNEAAGPDQSVYDAVNAIRKRTGVGMPALPTGLSQAQMRDAIRKERQIELAFEEHRYYDVRRWKIANVTENVPAYGMDVTRNGSTYTYTRKEALSGRRFEDKHYFLPIPRAEILASGGKLTQNAGY